MIRLTEAAVVCSLLSQLCVLLLCVLKASPSAKINVIQEISDLICESVDKFYEAQDGTSKEANTFNMCALVLCSRS